MATTNIPSGLSVVGTRGHSCTGTVNPTGEGVTMHNSRIRVECPGGATGLKVAYSNFLNGDSVPANAITVTCSIESSGGTIHQGTVSGSPSATIAISSDVVFDVPGLSLAAGSFCWIRTCVTVTSGQTIPATIVLSQNYFAGDSWQQNANPNQSSQPTGTTDLTAGGSFPATNNFDKNVFGPLALLGTPLNPDQVGCGIFGDSIMQAVTGAKFYLGYVAYALSNQGAITGTKYPYINFGLNGEQLRGFIANSATSYRIAVARKVCNVVIGEHLVNDIRNGTAAATMQADLASFATLFNDRTCIYCTTTPNTTSSNGYLSPDDQVVYSTGKFGVGELRDQMLAYLRGPGASQFSAIFDAAAVLAAVAPGGSAYKWPVGTTTGNRYTSDGLHPSTVADAVLATVVDKSKLVLKGPYLASIQIEPASVTVERAAGSQQFTAAGVDQNGQPFTFVSPLGWAKTSGVGSINSTGLYTPGNVSGTATITATSGSITASASITVSDTTPPAVPADLMALEGNTNVVLTWAASTSGDAVGTKLRRNGTLIYSGTNTIHPDVGLTNGTQYSYTVSAIDADGVESGQSAAVTATPGAGSNSDPVIIELLSQISTQVAAQASALTALGTTLAGVAAKTGLIGTDAVASKADVEAGTQPAPGALPITWELLVNNQPLADADVWLTRTPDPTVQVIDRKRSNTEGVVRFFADKFEPDGVTLITYYGHAQKDGVSSIEAETLTCD